MPHGPAHAAVRFAATARCRTVVIGVALATILSMPTFAEAQRGETERDPRALRTAELLFGRAMELLEQDRFGEARDTFRESMSAYPTSGTAFNLARALHGTGEVSEAVRLLDRVLAGEFGRIDPRRRRQADRFREELMSEIGELSLRLEGAPRAEIRVDGVSVGEAVRGEVLTRAVDPGRRVVVASASDYETVEERIEVARGARHELTFTLLPTEEASYGTLDIAAGATETVRINGDVAGLGPLERRVTPGRYLIQIGGADGGRSSEVVVAGGQWVRVALTGGGGDVLESPWLWLGVGLGLAALVAGGLILFLPIQQGPVEGSVATLTARY